MERTHAMTPYFYACGFPRDSTLDLEGRLQDMAARVAAMCADHGHDPSRTVWTVEDKPGGRLVSARMSSAENLRIAADKIEAATTSLSGNMLGLAVSALNFPFFDDLTFHRLLQNTAWDSAALMLVRLMKPERSELICEGGRWQASFSVGSAKGEARSEVTYLAIASALVRLKLAMEIATPLRR